MVFKRWFEPQQLVDELGGGDVVHAGSWFVAARARSIREPIVRWTPGGSYA